MNVYVPSVPYMQYMFPFKGFDVSYSGVSVWGNGLFFIGTLGVLFAVNLPVARWSSLLIVGSLEAPSKLKDLESNLAVCDFYSLVEHRKQNSLKKIVNRTEGRIQRTII